jgi:hypothetical protein
MHKLKTTALFLFGLGFAACSGLKSNVNVPAQHPEALSKGRPTCSAEACHGSNNEGLPFARFDHSPSFSEGAHRNEAYQQGKVCAMCHEQSFCNDCHVTSSELKPSAKDPTGSYRIYPHRGDYLTRHRIDARVDPMPCFRCHGNPKASRACTACHGK